jgi:hypothetical protein
LPIDQHFSSPGNVEFVNLVCTWNVCWTSNHASVHDFKSPRKKNSLVFAATVACTASLFLKQPSRKVHGNGTASGVADSIVWATAGLSSPFDIGLRFNNLSSLDVDIGS